MLENLCIKYLQFNMRKCKNIELVIRPMTWTYRKRDFEEEESIKETLKLIK